VPGDCSDLLPRHLLGDARYIELPMTVPHSYNANELLNLAGAVEQAPYIKLIHATFDGELSERAQQMIVTALRALASPSSSGPESEAEAACAAMVKWCDKNDWGSVPKKLELQMRKACRATPQQPDCDRIDGCCTNPTLCAREKRCRND
jgi:hypothetical protein